MYVTALGQGYGNKRDGLVVCWLPPKSVLLPHTHVGTGGNGAAWGEGGKALPQTGERCGSAGMEA